MTFLVDTRYAILFAKFTPYPCRSGHPYLPYGKPISHTRQIWVSRRRDMGVLHKPHNQLQNLGRDGLVDVGVFF